MRIREIDFLRGIAVLLVLFRHRFLTALLFRIGWIGVDLFFVLSGFLVSQLLFKEHIKYGKIDPVNFLIRRGFKIYPTFYLILILTISLSFVGISNKWYDVTFYNSISEFLFVQNYFGKLWNHTWSLAVEEHFYIFLSLSIWLLTKYFHDKGILVRFFIFILIFCLASRILIFQYFNQYYNAYYTHLRIDSLAFGTLIAYYYSYHFTQLEALVLKYKYFLLALTLSTPILPLVYPFENGSVYTWGFNFLYTGFGSLLLLMLFHKKTRIFPGFLMESNIVKIIAGIGVYSYSIYIIHMPIDLYIVKNIPESTNYIILFAIYFILSIVTGILLSKVIEFQFLKFRDQYFQNN